MGIGYTLKKSQIPYTATIKDEYGNVTYVLNDDWEIVVTKQGNLMVIHQGVCKKHGCSVNDAIQYLKYKLS